jgi:hypothetical protein
MILLKFVLKNHVVKQVVNRLILEKVELIF